MKKLFFFLITVLIPLLSFNQIVTLTPSDAGPDDAVTVTFDAAEGNGELVGAAKVYMHHGVVLDAPDGTAWSNVVGNWGADDGVGQMTAVSGETDKWEYVMTPSIREYYGVAAGTDIFRISAVFRSADGNTKGTYTSGDYGWGSVVGGGDFFINLNVSNFVSINAPLGSEAFVASGEPVTISASASSDVTVMKIWIDEGSGFSEVASVSSGTTITYDYSTTTTTSIEIKVTATIGGEDVESSKSYNVVIQQATVQEDLPAGIRKGINYHAGDETKVTLVLEAPGKEFAYVVGDFSNWNIADSNQMKQTTDGEFLWLEIDDLVPQKEYVFQYWVDGEAKIGDPYAEKIADPWNDKYIEESVYPNLPEYDKTDFQTATVFQTGQTDYVWDASESSWVRPSLNHLVIYELLVRDFVGTHSYSTLMDTLDYLKRLGVDAIELMPFNEFEGNESWGYNPSYYFAPDKYYGPKDSLKKFIEVAHQEGFAVIMDMVLNHAFGQNALVKLFWDDAADKPTADNPWFNRDLPANHYGWGSDFNHESDYTKAFMDSVNTYWLEEYHIDGYRFDYTKGFTNSTSPDNYDAGRIAILKRMADKIWAKDISAYVILEHWGPSTEETELANYGMKLWSNRSYDYVPAITGAATGNFNSMDRTSHVQYFNSHDESRIAEHALTEGRASSDGKYDVKNPLNMYERKKMTAAFALLFPGPKMLWQFDELAYDIDINLNGRTGNKPLPWGPDGLGYYEDELRQHVYSAFKGILDVRKQIGAANLATATTQHILGGAARRLSYDMATEDLVVIGNFGVESTTINPMFTQTGTWYNYFSGEEITVTDTEALIDLKAGEWHIFTSTKYSDGLPGVIEVYQNPVTVTPYPFTKKEEITITFDATLASSDGTAGLVGASTVFIESGVTMDHPDSTTLHNVVYSEMTSVGGDIWEITLTPEQYYSLGAEDEIFKIGMYFRDADTTNVGKGFRNSMIYVDVDNDDPFIIIEPAAFEVNDVITITFNARKGDKALMGADKVYLHSSVDITDTETPHNTGWDYAVGNWGADDGVGEMTAVDGKEDFWELSVMPMTYYGVSLTDTAFWVAMVFRSADGNTKASDTPGEIENGYIHTSGDIFIRNEIGSGSTAVEFISNDITSISIYPNPANEYITIGQEGITQVAIYAVTGQLIKEVQFDGTSAPKVNISELQTGLYFVKSIDSKNTTYAGRFLKVE